MPDDENKRYERERERSSRDDSSAYRSKSLKDYNPDFIRTDIYNISEEVFKRKIEDFFREIGYDVSDYEEKRRLRRELEYVSISLAANVERKSTVTRSLITSFIGAFIGIITTIITYVVSHK